MATFQRTANGWRAIIQVRTPDGRRIRRKRHAARKSDLTRWVREEEGRLQRIARGEEQLDSNRRLGDLIDLYLRSGFEDEADRKRRRVGLGSLKGEKQRRRRRSQLEWWRERLGHLPVAKVTGAVVARQLDLLDIESSSRNRMKSALSAVYKLAISRHELPRASNPTIGLHEGEGKGRTRWLDDKERRILLEAVEEDPDLSVIVPLAISSGMRRGEIIRLRWRDVDWQRQQLSVVDTKNGRSRSAVLVDRCKGLLGDRRKVRRINTDLIFPGRTGQPSFPAKRWNAAREECRKRGVPHFRFHDLRHTAASIFLQRGGSLAQCAEFLGCSFQNVQRYGHLVTSDVADQARRLLADVEL